MLGAAFLAAAALTLAAGLLSLRQPAPAGVAMVAAAFFVALIDGLGPVPFLRAVRAHERAQMTAVYRTYLDASELLPPLAYFFLFMLGGFAAAFAALALLLGGHRRRSPCATCRAACDDTTWRHRLKRGSCPGRS